MENEGESCPSTNDVPLSPLGPPRQRTPSGTSTRPIFFDPNISPIQNPSPVQKKLTGVSSNARNDIYLRTLVNSPYQKSFTPISSTSFGFSPAFRTPVRNKEPNAEPTSTPQEICPSRTYQGTPNNPQIHHGVSQTPEGTRPTHYANQMYATPQNEIQNPFEPFMMERLHMPTFMSPGVFSATSNPASEEKKQFRWSIEHLAVLHPADIDEMPHQQDAHHLNDKDLEERAQRAIDQFFANHMIAPSPWSDDKKKVPKTAVLLPGPEGKSPSTLAHLEGSVQKQLPKNTGTQEVECQTLLSLPVNFDIQKVLGNYMSQDTDEDAVQEVLSTSSLRRKLFFNADTSSLAPSPVHDVQCDDEPVVFPPVAPPMTPKWDNHQTPLKNTPAFASSPIKTFQTPKQKMHLSDTDFLASPELSPIVHGHMQDKGSLKKSYSYGVFATHLDGSFEISSGHDTASGRKRHTGDAQSKDLDINSPPVSPIPSFRIDSLEETSDHRLPNSPGVSPIHPPKMSIPKHSPEMLYLDTSLESGERMHSIDESNTPVSKSTYLPDRLKGSLPKARSFSTFRDLGETSMDYEITQKSRHIQFADNILTSSVYDTLHYSMSDLDYPNETNVPPSQDTGYQTASLQSTNQDTGLHTNMTGQFNSLPFNITSQESNFHSSSQSSTSSERPLPTPNFAHTHTNLSTQDVMPTNFKTLPTSLLLHSNKDTLSSRQDDSAFSDDSHEISSLQHTHSKEGEETIDEEGILQRARQVLAMANNLYPQEVKQMGLTEQNITPTIATTWLEPLIASTPQKKLNNYLMKQREKGYGITASEIAASILKRAGEDLAKYGHIIGCDEIWLNMDP